MVFRPPKATIPPFNESLVRAASHQAVLEATKELVRFAREEAAIFGRRIAAQRFEAFHEFPLAASTLAKKRRYGRSLKVMVSTGTYSGSIRALVYPTRGGGVTIRIAHAPALLARDTRTGLRGRG